MALVIKVTGNSIFLYSLLGTGLKGPSVRHLCWSTPRFLMPSIWRHQELDLGQMWDLRLLGQWSYEQPPDLTALSPPPQGSPRQ